MSLTAWFTSHDRHVERALVNAAAIKASYGANAELWFEGQLAGADRDTRRALRKVRKALRQLH